MLHHIIPYILGFITLPSILKLLSFIPKRPLNLIADFVLPNADDPGWEEMGGYWKLGNVVVMNFNKIEIKGIKVHTSPKLIKKYQEAIRTAYMHYHLDMPEIKVKGVFEPDKDYSTPYSIYENPITIKRLLNPQDHARDQFIEHMASLTRNYKSSQPHIE